MIREPCVAGQFYSDDPEELRQQIEDSFKSKFGPGFPEKKKGKSKIKAIISPHAGYFFSGACAAHGFKEIAEGNMPDTFIIIGLSHNYPKTAVSKNDWKTPSGTVKNDKELTEMIAKNCSIPVDERLHSFEHSLEVQVPFLQFIFKGKEINISPIIVSEDTDFKEIGKGIKKAIKESKKDIIIITSSDFTHFGSSYGYHPFNKDVKENLYKLDKGAIDLILKKDSKGFLQYIEKTGATICGRIPIATLLEAVECKKIRLLKYYTSGDVIGDYSSAVGYASIAFYG